MVEQERENQAKGQAILGLHQTMLRDVAELTRSPYASRAVEFLSSRPVFASTHFIEGTGIPSPTALRFLRELRGAAIIHTLREKAGSRAAIYVFPHLLEIAEGRTAH